MIVVPNRGVPQNVQTNNAWVSFINHDGSVHTARWIGVQNPAERASLTPPLVLNEPYGSDIANGMLYVADRDGGTTPDRAERRGDPPLQHADGRAGGRDPRRQVDVVQRHRGRGRRDGLRDADRRRRRQAGRVDLAGLEDHARTAAPSIFVQGAPLRQPNGIAFDPQGNIVVVNIGNTEVLTFSPRRQAGEDGERGAGGQRWPRDHARRHEVREQRA